MSSSSSSSSASRRPIPHPAHSQVQRLIPAALLLLLSLAGCSHLSPRLAHEYVWVWLRDGYLIDRVSIVNNRVAEVANGERLQVLEHGQRFLRVKTPKGEIGWIEEHGVIDQKIYDQFTQLAKQHRHDLIVSSGVLLEDYWLRDAPGRKSDRFLLLPENEKVQMLERASVPKPIPPQLLPMVRQQTGKSGAPPPPVLEDYWLVRDSQGHVGWVRGRALDVNVPDAIAGLGESEKIVGAWVLRTVFDPDASVPGNQVPEYLAILAPWKDGLPYDFDQVRVFSWNVKKHRYETAYRERNIAGYLPVTIAQQTFNRQQEPVFSYRVALGDAAALDPATGMVRPGATFTESYHMEGVIVRRIGDQAPPPDIAHPDKAQFERDKNSRKKRR